MHGWSCSFITLNYQVEGRTFTTVVALWLFIHTDPLMRSQQVTSGFRFFMWWCYCQLVNRLTLTLTIHHFLSLALYPNASSSGLITLSLFCPVGQMGQRTKYPMLISTCPNTNSSCKVVFNRVYFALRLQNVQLHLSSNVFTCHSFLWEFSLVPKNHLFRQVSCVWRTFVNYVAGWTKRAPNNITATRGVQNKL